MNECKPDKQHIWTEENEPYCQCGAKVFYTNNHGTTIRPAVNDPETLEFP